MSSTCQEKYWLIQVLIQDGTIYCTPGPTLTSLWWKIILNPSPCTVSEEFYLIGPIHDQYMSKKDWLTPVPIQVGAIIFIPGPISTSLWWKIIFEPQYQYSLWESYECPWTWLLWDAYKKIKPILAWLKRAEKLPPHTALRPGFMIWPNTWFFED